MGESFHGFRNHICSPTSVAYSSDCFGRFLHDRYRDINYFLSLTSITSWISRCFRNKNLSWVVNAYTIGVASLLLVSGWLADRYGRKKLFFGGLFIFFLASFVAALSPSADFSDYCSSISSNRRSNAISCRPCPTSCSFPPARIQTAIGIWGATGGLAAALGPTVGALLVDAFDWQAVFFINVPVAAVVLVFGPPMGLKKALVLLRLNELIYWVCHLPLLV